MTDTVEKLACETLGIYGSYRAARRTTASGMLPLSKTKLREFFNSIDPEGTFCTRECPPPQSHTQVKKF
jgi:hypothetical protein